MTTEPVCGYCNTLLAKQEESAGACHECVLLVELAETGSSEVPWWVGPGQSPPTTVVGSKESG